MENKVIQLKKAEKLPNGIEFFQEQEIEIVMDVVYIGGFPLPPNVQATVLNWIAQNPDKFINVTRNWK
jgi:hypothetical protein